MSQMRYHLKNIEVEASIGVYEQEKLGPQRLVLNVRYDFESLEAALSDNLNDTVDYAQIETLLHEFCAVKHYELLETLHRELSAQLNQKFPLVTNLVVSIEKFPFKSGSLVVT